MIFICALVDAAQFLMALGRSHLVAFPWKEPLEKVNTINTARISSPRTVPKFS